MPNALATNVNSRNIPEKQPTAAETKAAGRLATKRAPEPTPVAQSSQKKTIARRSSKPILNWFQRKLAGTVKAKRVEQTGKGRGSAIPLKVTSNRVASSPLPSPVLQNGGRQQSRMDALAAARRNTVSLNGDDDTQFSRQSDDDDDDRSIGESSMARESTWSPLEADEDASVRPLPPSSPPSPSPSRSSSSYLSDPRTFRSIAASTKPTTLLSIDLNGNGMAHIAQAPLTPSQITRFPPHARSSSTGTNPQLLGSGPSMTFSALPPSTQSSRPSSGQNTNSSQITGAPINSVQAPLHTTHHPRNNPRPSSPPMDNASMLTLASSAFGVPGHRTPAWISAPPSAMGASDSVSHFGGSVMYADDAESTSQLGDDRMEERDVDASVRALRPRSSRRGSWESEVSRWSAREPGTGTPVTRERSVWTANSVKTGAFSDNADNAELDDTESITVPESVGPEEHSVTIPISPVSDSEPTPRIGVHTVLEEAEQTVAPSTDRQTSADTVAQLATLTEEKATEVTD
ncbi:hypothetical protein C8J56DRAFT_935044 [Mycena floridula]|nr:hypothetical protein C8J56DRAFT_935044 [Mycena floridula]